MSTTQPVEIENTSEANAPLVIAKPSALDPGCVYSYVQAGQTVAAVVGVERPPNYETLDSAADRLYVEHNGKILEAEHWYATQVRQGDVLNVIVRPQDGGGNKSGQGMLRTALSIAMFSFVGGLPAAAGAPIWAAELTRTALAVGGQFLLYNLIPPKESSENDDEFVRSNALTGASNQVNAFGVIPKLYGRMRYHPPIPMTAKPFSELRGDSQYLRMMLVLTQGRMEIAGNIVGEGHDRLTLQDVVGTGAVEIGDTDIGEYEDVELEICTADQLQIYTDRIEQEHVDIEMNASGDQEVRTSAVDGGQVGVDLWFTQGLFETTDDGDTLPAAVEVTIEYAPTGTTDWRNAAFVSNVHLKTQNAVDDGSRFRLRNDKRETFRASIQWPVDDEQVDVRVTRHTAEGGDNTRNNMTWANIRTVVPRKAWVVPDTVVMAMVIKASGQLSGNLDNVSVLGTGVTDVPVENDSGGYEWVEQATRNPAYQGIDVLTGTATIEPLDRDSEIWIDEFIDFADLADSKGLTFNHVFDAEGTTQERFNEVVGAARGTLGWHDGRFSVVTDLEEKDTVQMVTPRNARDFSGEKVYNDPVHAYRVQFTDPDTWDSTERIVYDDGQNASSATRIELLETAGVTDPDQAFKEGRYRLAENRLRVETFTFVQDVENLVYMRGSWVRVNYDVIAVGSGWGRIVEVERDGNNAVTKVYSDEELVLEAGNDYAVRVRTKNNNYVVGAISTGEGRHFSVEFDSPIDEEVEVGDLFLYGIADQEDITCIVMGVRPKTDLSAEVTVVPASPGIYTADEVGIPPYDPVVTEPPDLDRLPLVAPEIVDIRSDESVLYKDVDGSLQARMVIDYNYPPGHMSLSIEARFRSVFEDNNQQTTSAWAFEVVSSDRGRIDVLNVEGGQEYELQIRAVDLTTGRSSAWTPITTHVVVGKTSDPSNVSGFTYNVRDFGVRFHWDDIPDPDRDEFEIREGDDWGSGSFITRTRSLTHSIDTLIGGTYSFWIKAFDTSGNESEQATELVVEIGIPLSVSTTLNFQGPDMVLNWDESTSDFQVEEYEVHQGDNFSAATLRTRIKGTEYRRKADWAGTETFWIVAVDVAGNRSLAAEESVTVEVPTAPVISRLQTIDNNVLLQWNIPTTHTLPIDSYQIRRGDDFATAVIVGQVGGTFSTVQESEAGEFRYHIAAVDAAGNVGAASSSQTRVNSPPDYVLRNDDALDPTNGTYNTSAVYATADSNTIYAPVDSTETWQDVIDNGYNTLQDEIDAGYTHWLTPSAGGNASWELEVDYGTVLPGTLINFEVDEEVLQGNPTVRYFIATRLDSQDPWEEAELQQLFVPELRYARYRILVEADSDDDLIRLSQLRSLLEIKLRSDDGTADLVLAGNAVELNGSDQYIDLNKNLNDYPDDFTIEVWTHLNAAQPRQRIWSGGDTSSGNSGFTVFVTGDSSTPEVQFRFSDDTDTTVSHTETVYTNYWLHLAMTKSGTTVTFFVNGEQVHQGEANSSNFKRDFDTALGAVSGSITHPLNGRIDNPRIWSIARTPAEIAANYETELDGSQNGLVHNWLMNENDGTTLADSSGTNDATLVNDPAWTQQRGDRVNFGIDYITVTSIIVTPEDEIPTIAMDKFRDVLNPNYFRAYKFNSVTGERATGLVNWQARGV